MRIWEILQEKESKRRTSNVMFGDNLLKQYCPVAWSFYEKYEYVPLYRGIGYLE